MDINFCGLFTYFPWHYFFSFPLFLLSFLFSLFPFFFLSFSPLYYYYMLYLQDFIFFLTYSIVKVCFNSHWLVGRVFANGPGDLGSIPG